MSSEQVELFAEAVRQPGATMEDLQDAVPPEQPQLSSTSRKVRWESPFMTSYWGRKHCYSMGTMLLFVICSEGLHLGEDFLSTIVHYIFSVHSVEVNEEEATEDNWTLLHYCAAYGNDRLASILIGKGADVNAPGRRGMLWTPLHLAVNGARINVIKVMLSHDRDGVTLDTTLQDSGARTALDIAREYNQKGCVQLLVDHESAKNASAATDRPPETFQSQFQKNFEEVKILGKGGFGVVFQARKKHNRQQYAIKRVLLREGMRSKVMREVDALASLDHQNIVRYFNSWEERPPVGHIFDDDDIGVESGDGLDGDEDEDDEDEYDDECNDELGDAVSDLATRSTPADSSSMSNPMRHFPGRRPIPSYSSDNESSGGIVFGDLSAQNSTDNSRLAASPLFTTSASRSNSSSYTDGIIARGTDGDDSSTSCTDTSVMSKKSSMSEHSDSPPVYLYIQMQLCKKMNLKDWLHDHVSDRSLQQATKIFLQIVRAVGYVHDNKLMHRDLKPSNVFFARDGQVKVGDFGLATESGHHRNLSRDDLHALACEFGSGAEGEHTGQVGTEIYMSPELMKGQKYCDKVDIFSLGIIFVELLCPFETQMERVLVLCKARKHQFPQDFNEDQRCIIRELLAIDPGHRPTARELYKKDLFKEILIQEAARGW